MLLEVAEEQKISEKLQAMVNGDEINTTEKRKVWHVKLRTRTSES